MFSEGAGASLQNTENTLTVSSLPAGSQASFASSATPTKAALDGSGPADTPQSIKNNAHDQGKAFIVPGDVPANSSTKTQKGTTKKRTRPSPKKDISKKLLFTGEETGDGTGGSDSAAATSDQNSPSKDA